MYPIEKLNNWEYKHFSDMGWVFCNEIKFIYIHIEEYGIIIEKAGKDDIELTLEELQTIYETAKMIEKEEKNREQHGGYKRNDKCIIRIWKNICDNYNFVSIVFVAV